MDTSQWWCTPLCSQKKITGLFGNFSQMEFNLTDLILELAFLLIMLHQKEPDTLHVWPILNEMGLFLQNVPICKVCDIAQQIVDKFRNVSVNESLFHIDFINAMIPWVFDFAWNMIRKHGHYFSHIHPKSENIGSFSKLAEKVHKSGRQHFATKLH